MTRFYAAAAWLFKRRTTTPSSLNTRKTKKTKTQRDEHVGVCSLLWKDVDESLLVRVLAVQTERGAVTDSSAVVKGRSGRPLEDEGAVRVNHMSFRLSNVHRQICVGQTSSAAVSLCKGRGVKAKVHMKALRLQRKHEGGSITRARVPQFEEGGSGSARQDGILLYTATRPWRRWMLGCVLLGMVFAAILL